MKYLFVSILILCFVHLASSQNPWELKKDEDGIKVWIANSEDSPFKSYKCQTVIDAPLDRVLNYLILEENIPIYYEMVSRITDIKKISENASKYILEIDFPWPLKNRIAHIEAKYYPVEVGAYDIETKAIAFDGSNRDCVVVNNMRSTFSLVNAGEGKTYLKHHGFIDPNGFVPARIANLKLVDAPFKTLKFLKRTLQTFDENGKEKE